MRALLLIVFIFTLSVFAQAQGNLSLSCSLFNGNSVSAGPAIPVGQYQVKFRHCEVAGQTWIGLREFTSRGRSYDLLTEPQTLQTQILDKTCLRCADVSFADLPDGAYKKTLKQQMSPPFPLANDGFSHARTSKSLFLTVDLCPSHKSFDAQIFENAKVKNQASFPVGISISGGWLQHFQNDFHWLKNQALDKKLNIVWINHSYTHPYVKGLPNDQNFMLMPKVNFADEVLKQEQYMISNGVTPSVFFRFPGLISNQALINQLSQYGIISLGSDAWLARGKPAKPGSIVLIHGNGNEELGVSLFLKLLDSITDMGIFRPLIEAPR